LAPAKPALTVFSAPQGARRLCCVIGLIQTLACWALVTVAAGDMVWVKGQEKPLSGRIVSQSDAEIQIEKFVEGRFGEVTSIRTDQVDSVVVNFDPERLAELSPDNPTAYRNYAEELCTQRADPAAIHLARRLYLLAAANSVNSSQKGLRAGAILGLISLAPDESQRQNLELFHRLFHPSTEPQEAKSKTQSAVDNPPTEVEKELMLKIVIAIRRENSETAIGLLGSAQNRESIKKLSNLCTLQELDLIATSDQPSKLQLRKLLSVELAIRQPGIASPQPVLSRSSWGELAMQPAPKFSALPTFANVTEFDPNRSVYRNGVWVRP